jgi:mRNA-degrading endonuclease RelE of RelBE toxin-antitoxin system
MSWTVTVHRKVARSVPTLPRRVQETLELLLRELELNGPVRGNWPHYSKLPHQRHHCHLTKGRPTYVALWEEGNTRLRLLEVIYVGTHENAPY